MDRKEELKQLKEEYLNTKIPKDGPDKIEQAITRARLDQKRAMRKTMICRWGLGAAAALALTILPNTNAQIAYAMGNLPLVGGLFQVITIREYNYQDSHNEINVSVPLVTAESAKNQPAVTDSSEKAAAVETDRSGQAMEQINQDIQAYTDELIRRFEADMEENGHQQLDISYQTVTDTDTWFTLRIDGLEIKASGYQFSRFYHIDKTTGKVAELKDLFTDGADYITPISNEIKRQMKEQIDRGESSYFMEEDGMDAEFKELAANQNFYLDDGGNLVIVFNEYEIGPGSIGSPEFVIPAEVVKDIRK